MTDNSEDETPADPHPLLVPTLALLSVITALVSSLGAPLVPTIARTENVSISAAQWTLTIALLTGAVSTPLVGRLGNNRLRRRSLVLGMVVVTSGNLLAALPIGFTGLLVGRAMQGVGVSLAPLALGVAREFVAPADMHRAISRLSVAAVTGAGLGYPVTSLFADRLGLSAAFWFGFACSALTLAATIVVVPPSTSTVTDTVDWLGGLLLTIGTATLLLVLTQGSHWGWTSPTLVGLTVCAACTLTAFVVRTLYVSYPLVDLRLAVRKGVAAANVTALAAGTAMYLVQSLIMLLVQADPSSGYGLGKSVTVAGMLLTPYAVFSVLGNRITRFLFLSHRLRPDHVLPVGCSIYLLATVMLLFAHTDVSALLLVMALAGLGSGCTFTAMPGLLVRYVPIHETGSAMAFNQVLRFLGFSTGSALTLTLLQEFADDGEMTASAFQASLAVAATIWTVAAVGTMLMAGKNPEGELT